MNRASDYENATFLSFSNLTVSTMANTVDHGSRRMSIVSLILLCLFVCSVGVNFLLWRWGDTQTQHVTSAQTRLLKTQAELRAQAEQVQLLKSMLGLGALAKADFDSLKQAGTGDPEMDVIASSFTRDMELFGPDVELQNRNYPTLSMYLNTALTNYRSTDEAATESANLQGR